MPNRNHDASIANELPFRDLVDFDIEICHESSKTRIQKLMDDHRLTKFVNENTLSRLLQSEDSIRCSYHDEASFNTLNLSDNEHINVFSLNIRSLPLHGGQLLAFLIYIVQFYCEFYPTEIISIL